MLGKFARLFGIAVAAMAMPALAAAPALADSPTVTINISNTGTLQADGSALITVTYTCLAGFGTGQTGDLEAFLEQPAGFGGAAAVAVCDDRSHTVTLDESPGPFTAGEAAANVSLTTGLDESGTAQTEVALK